MANIHIEPEIDRVPVASTRKHLKKLYSAVEYAQRYNRINYYRPHPETQLVFHNSPAKERALFLGTQQGKTTAASFEITYSALGRWPEWHKGLHPAPPKLERAANFIGWYASNSSQAVRDGAQEKLIGPVSRKEALGTGAIPLDAIEEVTMARGISNFADTITVRRDDGTIALLQSRTYEQSVLMWQGVPVDMVWIDEDPGLDDRQYNEALARTISTGGRIICSLTPMLGLTPLVRRFQDHTPGTFFVTGGIEQALHIDKDRIAEIIRTTPERERASRILGRPMKGEGAVFTTPVDSIIFDQAPDSFPSYWPIVNACDFSHGGMSSQSHPMAVISAAQDPATGTIYIFDAFTMKQMNAEQQVRFIKQRSKVWDAPWLWPHDGSQVASAGTGETYSRLYRRLGLPMRPEHTTFKEGGYSFEAGIAEMQVRFANGTLLVARHLHDWFREYSNYHYADGKIVKVDDDLMSATRQVVMGIRHARVLEQTRSAVGSTRGWDGEWRRKRDRGGYVAEGTPDYPDFDFSY